MTAASLQAVHPVLPSRDVSGSIDFYVQRLGFELAFRDSESSPHYAGLVRGGVEIHLQWHDPAEWAAVERPMLRFVVAGIESLFAEYEAQGVFHAATALRTTPWGTREFAFYDPDGNGLTFYCDAG